MARLSLKQRALGLLARRDHSFYELKAKLQRPKIKGQSTFNEQEINNLLSELQSQNLLNDFRFAHHYVEYRSGKGFGPEKIYYELRQKGLSKDLLEEIAAQQNLSWLELAEKARRKKFGAGLPKNIQEIVKQQRFLLSRGFSKEIIFQLLKT